MSWDFLLDVIKNGFDRRNRRNGRGTPNMLNQAPIGWKTIHFGGLQHPLDAGNSFAWRNEEEIWLWVKTLVPSEPQNSW